jgi:hypothetical protein
VKKIMFESLDVTFRVTKSYFVLSNAQSNTSSVIFQDTFEVVVILPSGRIGREGENVVARSTAEAEYKAMTHSVSEGLWLRRLLLELELFEDKPIMLYCDNKAAIANNPVQHDRTKHVEIDRHFIKDKLDEGIVCMPFVGTKEQIADVFIKGLSITDFSNVIGKMSMINIYASS